MDPRIDDYLLLDLLGEGAAGKVYLARLTTPKPFAGAGDPLALKLYKEGILKESHQLERIENEFRIGAQIAHPNVVRIYEHSVKDITKPYLVMEYIDGLTLDAWIQMFHPVSIRLLLNILIQIISGIKCLHESGVVHRDVKPNNIMLSSSFQAKIMDLGVVQIDTKKGEITPPDKFLGTIRNSSPEMLLGQEYDFRTDLYSFGTILYFVLHGEEIFSEEKQFARLVGMVKEVEPAFDDSLKESSDVHAKLLDLAKNLLKKDPNTRPQSAHEVLEELQKISIPSVSDRRPLRGYVASALTGLPVVTRDFIAFASSKIAEVCKKFEIYVHQPRKATDPILHKDIKPEVVYALDRKRIVDADVLIVIANDPSFGVGQELEIAGSYGKPVILLRREGVIVSRMVTGGLFNLIDDITYSTPEDLERKLRSSLKNSIESLRSWELRNALMEKSLPAEIGPILRKCREQSNYTLPEAANAAGISSYLLSTIENRPVQFHNVGLCTLINLSNLYGVSPVELIKGVKELPLRKDQLEIDRNIRRLEALSVKMGWSHRDFLELRSDYSKELAASGSPAEITDSEWISRHSFLEKRKLEGTESSKTEAPGPLFRQSKK